jgi:hypothetical protein
LGTDPMMVHPLVDIFAVRPPPAAFSCCIVHPSWISQSVDLECRIWATIVEAGRGWMRVTSCLFSERAYTHRPSWATAGGRFGTWRRGGWVKTMARAQAIQAVARQRCGGAGRGERGKKEVKCPHRHAHAHAHGSRQRTEAGHVVVCPHPIALSVAAGRGRTGGGVPAPPCPWQQAAGGRHRQDPRGDGIAGSTVEIRGMAVGKLSPAQREPQPRRWQPV